LTRNPLQSSLYAPSARPAVPSNYFSYSVVSRLESIERNFSDLKGTLEAVLKMISSEATKNSADKPNIQPEVIISPVQANSTIETALNKLIGEVANVELV